MDEHRLIHHYLRPLATDRAAGNLEDDAAILPTLGPQQEHAWIITQDSIVENVHFLPNTAPEDIARKLLRVNLSDCAAMGAVPYGYTLGATLPAACMEPAWVQAFCHALQEEQHTYQLTLLGGDTVIWPEPHTATTAPLVLSLTLLGTVSPQHVWKRSGAQPGDIVAVSGSLGDAALGLHLHQAPMPELSDRATAYLKARYTTPKPRTAVAKAFQENAIPIHAAMDLSDGLWLDAERMCHASHMSMTLDFAALPLSEAAQEALQLAPALQHAPISGGDDYELLLTLPASAWEEAQQTAAALDIPLTAIGQVVAQQPTTEPVTFDHLPPDISQQKGYMHDS